ncbi:zf-HC2 domain-containing protein [Micromonospora sp. WMMD987]|uniref:zf-HC2 domain-containing protein n=1 Tax=Micromonospora sp. WMMD987 TaxID=3016089 RepID=UPI00249B1CE5|nr:zf-HC2 domain-containing protein [Micromonospora sp. WMMD987]WFE93160.1 zf-HC2 domain-containing protein [Micromonospora sp. WMMD987]
MGCEQWREILSAQLDGEETPAERIAADAHLDRCVGCREWCDRAATVTRRSRLTLSTPGPDRQRRTTVAPGPGRQPRTAATPGPDRRHPTVGGPGSDLCDVVLATLPAPRRLRNRIVVALRAGLALIGALQLVLGLAQVGRGPAVGHAHGALDALASGHLWHESAAWNIAVGAGFLVVATRRTPTGGLLPTLSAFVGALVLLSANDLVTGRVEPARLVSHGFLVTGYLIVVGLSRPRLRPDGPAGRDRHDRPAWRLPAHDVPTATPTLRLLPPHPGSARVRDRSAA